MVVLYTDVFLYQRIEGRRDEGGEKGLPRFGVDGDCQVWLDRLSIFGYRRGQVHPDGSRGVVVVYGVEIQWWHRRENARDADTVVHGTL